MLYFLPLSAMAERPDISNVTLAAALQQQPDKSFGFCSFFPVFSLQEQPG